MTVQKHEIFVSGEKVRCTCGWAFSSKRYSEVRQKAVTHHAQYPTGVIRPLQFN